jgi:hypothetical protein
MVLVAACTPTAAPAPPPAAAPEVTSEAQKLSELLAPQARAQIVVEQDAWLRQRHERCAAVPAGETADAQTLCLQLADRARLQELRAYRNAELNTRAAEAPPAAAVAYRTIAGAGRSHRGLLAPPGAAWFVAGDDQGTLRIYDRQSGAVRRALAPPTVEGGVQGPGVIGPLASSANRRILYVGRGNYRNGSLEAWDVESGELMWALPGQSSPVAAPSGANHAIFAETSNLRLVDVRTGEVEQPTFTAAGVVTGLSLSPDQRFLAVGSASGTVELWQVDLANKDLATRLRPTAVQRPYKVGSWVQQLVFSDDGAMLATAGRNSQITVWRVPTLEVIAEVESPLPFISSFSASHDLRYLYVGGSATPGGFGCGAVAAYDRVLETWHQFPGEFGMGPAVASVDDEGHFLATAKPRIHRFGWDDGAEGPPPCAKAAQQQTMSSSGVAMYNGGRGSDYGSARLPGGEPAFTPVPGAEIHVLSVYEARLPPDKKPKEPWWAREGGNPGDTRGSSIDVRVTRRAPLVLVLASYENIVWRLRPDPGVDIKQVIISSSEHGSAAVGARSATEILVKDWGYWKDEAAARQAIRNRTGKDLARYQGSYGAYQFEIR